MLEDPKRSAEDKAIARIRLKLCVAILTETLADLDSPDGPKKARAQKAGHGKR